jgi:hypothetical protein
VYVVMVAALMIVAPDRVGVAKPGKNARELLATWTDLFV